MKTFDGNPLEHSPASSHTDHAIAGYDYKVEVDLNGGSVKILETTVESTFKWHPKEIWVQLDHDWNTILKTTNLLSYNDLLGLFTKLKNNGFTGVSFDMIYYVNSPNSNDVFELYNPSNVMWDDVLTPTQNDLEKVLKPITDAGLDAKIMVQLYTNNNYVEAHKNSFVGKGVYDPDNPNLFFKNYTEALESIIPILNTYNVVSLSVFDEATLLSTKYPALMERMFNELDERFNGNLAIDLGFQTNFDYSFENYWDGKSFRNLIRQMTYLGWVSSSGDPLDFEWSFWGIPLESQTDQRVSVLERNLVNFWKPAFDCISSIYRTISENWGETGANTFDGYTLGEKYYSSLSESRQRYDEQERADFFCALMKASSELEINTVNVWKLSLAHDRNAPSYHAPGLIFFNTGWFGFPVTPLYRVLTNIIKSPPSS